MGGNWRYKASKYMIKTQKNGSTPTKPASNSFGNRLLRTKKLSTYFNERYQNEVRHMRANQDDGKLNAWDRAWLLLAVQQNTSNALVKSQLNEMSVENERLMYSPNSSQSSLYSDANEVYPPNYPSSPNSHLTDDEPMSILSYQQMIAHRESTQMTAIETRRQETRTKLFRPFESESPIKVDSSPPKSFACDQCDYTTHVEPNLIRHIRRHTGEKPYQCELCGRQFSRSDHFKNHRDSHQQQHHNENNKENVEMADDKLNEAILPKFGCGLCDYSTVNVTNLITHLRRHKGVRPYHCRFCKKRFLQEAHLNVHVTRRHQNMQ